MSEYPTYLIHYGIEGQKWGVRRYQNEDGSLTPDGREHYGRGLVQKLGTRKYLNNDSTLTEKGIKKYSKLLDKSEKSERGKRKLEKFERKTDLYGRYSHDSGHKSKKEQLRANLRFDNENYKKMHEQANSASSKRQEGKNPISDVKKYANTSLETATKLVNRNTGKEAQRIVQEYMNRSMNGLNYSLWEIGDFNSDLDRPGKYNHIDYTYDVKNKKLHQKKWK